MRYAPAENLLRLARLLSQSRRGLTVDDMALELDVSRRTAERLRASLDGIFEGLASSPDEETRKLRWTLPRQAFDDLSGPTVEVLATVDTAAREYDQRGESERAKLLREASDTLRAMMRPERLRRAEPDLEALMEAEGIAMRPGPRPVLAHGVLSVLRQAVLGMKTISVTYRGASESVTERVLCPYGILYGGRGWLVAHQEDKAELRLWRLDRLTSVTLLDRNFKPCEDFSLQDYAAQSFGVFQEPPLDVALAFSADVATDAAQWCFHPTQRAEQIEDGSLIVRFRAGGAREICHHLFSWGDKVRVMQPQSLADAILKMSKDMFEHHNNVFDH